MGTYQRKGKPNEHQRNMLSNVTMSRRQAERVRMGGSLESVPGDYALNDSEEEIRLRDARHRLEDMRIAKELGIDP
jgi:hypothetical protein